MMIRHQLLPTQFLEAFHLGFVCMFGGEGRGGVCKKKRSKWKKYMTLRWEDFGSSFKTKSPSSWGINKLYWRRV